MNRGRYGLFTSVSQHPNITIKQEKAYYVHLYTELNKYVFKATVRLGIQLLA